MKLLKSFGKLKRLNLIFRRVQGESMLPTFKPGQLVIAVRGYSELQQGNVVIFTHQGLEKIKRVSQSDPLKGVFVIGDNAAESTDSRTFGWLDYSEILGKVLWPRR